MKTIEFTIRPVKVEAVCEKCNEGFLRHTGRSNQNWGGKPTSHEHSCNKCFEVIELPDIYPHTEWRDVDIK